MGFELLSDALLGDVPYLFLISYDWMGWGERTLILLSDDAVARRRLSGLNWMLHIDKRSCM